MKLTDGSGSFISRSVAHADCHWMKTTKISAPIYRLDTYTAYIEAGNDLLHQSLTKNTCKYSSGFCRVMELPYSLLSWSRIKRKLDLTRNLGIYNIHQIGNFINVPDLSIGASILQEQYETFALDFGYMIQKVGSTLDIDLFNKQKLFWKTTKSSTQLEIQTSKIIERLEEQTKILNFFMQQTCQMNERLKNVDSFLLKAFPD